MKMLDLFSGIGGFHLAAQWVWGTELDVVGHCEKDSYCQKVLKKHWPNIPIFDDIHDLKGDEFETVELITGGFPCQPFSNAGKRGGKEDDRYLWPEMLRVITEANPRWVVGENVTGIINLALDDIISSLEGAGYETWTYIIPACGVGANHRRDRIWIIANNDSKYSDLSGLRTIKIPQFEASGIQNDSDAKKPRLERPKPKGNTRTDGLSTELRENVADTESKQTFGKIKSGLFASTSRNSGWWATEPGMGRVAHGIPHRVDRLKGLGNAIVPQVAAHIFEAIRVVDTLLMQEAT